MKQIFTYRYFRGSISFLLLIGILWTNVLTYFPSMIDPELEAIEFCVPMDADSEGKEKTSEEEFDNKIRVDFLFSKVIEFNKDLEIHRLLSLLSNYHPEIPTPPPELI
jgi:hypothetical protein